MPPVEIADRDHAVLGIAEFAAACGRAIVGREFLPQPSVRALQPEPEFTFILLGNPELESGEIVVVTRHGVVVAETLRAVPGASDSDPRHHAAELAFQHRRARRLVPPPRRVNSPHNTHPRAS